MYCNGKEAYKGVHMLEIKRSFGNASFQINYILKEFRLTFRLRC